MSHLRNIMKIKALSSLQNLISDQFLQNGSITFSKYFKQLFIAKNQYQHIYFIETVEESAMDKQSKNKSIKFKDLPPHLQNKYRNSPLFDKENLCKAKNIDVTAQTIQARRALKQKTLQEKLEEFEINQTELKYLLRVFQNLAKQHNQQYFTCADLMEVLKKMGVKAIKRNIQLMIWQFDEDLNKKISKKEFINMYKKCTIDKNGTEAKGLFHFVQFLMFCKPGQYKITTQDTLQLLYVRALKKAEIQRTDQRQILQQEIKVIFGEQQKTPDGLEKQIDFTQYMQKINKRAIQKRKQQMLKIKAQYKYGNQSS